jgi:hypothetical protein
MMNTAPAPVRNLALWLLAQEGFVAKSHETMDATFRVCEKLHQSLSALAGTAGYRSLISRALTLAIKETPSLEKIQVKEDGSLESTGAVDLQQGMNGAAKGGAVLVAQLLGLLFTFIGGSLTLRLVRDLWPDAPFEAIHSKMEKEL